MNVPTESHLAIPGQWDRNQFFAVLDLLDTLYDVIYATYEETFGGGCSLQIPLPFDDEDPLEDNLDF